MKNQNFSKKFFCKTLIKFSAESKRKKLTFPETSCGEQISIADRQKSEDNSAFPTKIKEMH